MTAPGFCTISAARRRMLATSAGGAAAILGLPHLAQPALAQSSRKPGIEGVRAPELQVSHWIDGNGKPANFSVEENRGKWVFMKFFQNWCPGCHKYGFPTLQKVADKFHDHPGVAITAVQTVFEGFSSNTADDVRKWQKHYELPIVMGHDAGDPDGEHRPQTMIDYRTGGTPWLVLVNPEGVVVFNDFHVDADRLVEYLDEQLA